MPAPEIDALPPVPLRTEAAGTFTPKAETFLDSLDTFRTQVNAVGDYIDSLGLDPADLPTAVTDLQMATARIIGRTTAGTGAAEELTAAQVRAFLGLSGTITEETGTTYSATADDFPATKEFNNASAITLTIPVDLDVATNTVFEIHQTGAGPVTFAGAVGVTVQSRGAALTTAGQYAIAGIKRVAENVYRVTGDVTA